MFREKGFSRRTCGFTYDCVLNIWPDDVGDGVSEESMQQLLKHKLLTNDARLRVEGVPLP